MLVTTTRYHSNWRHCSNRVYRRKMITVIVTVILMIMIMIMIVVIVVMMIVIAMMRV